MRNTLSIGLILLSLACLTGCETPVMMRQKGDAAYAERDYATAAYHYGRSVEASPNDPRALYGLGRSQLELGRAQAAEMTLRTAWTVEPNNEELTPEILDALADSLLAQPEQEAVLFDYLQVQAEQYESPDSFGRQGRYLAELGDVDNAVVAYRKAIAFADAADPSPFIALGDFYVGIGDNANAERYFRYAYHVDPNTDGLADRLRQLGVVPGPTAGLVPPSELRP